ncbi:MAG TPA: cation diffusion facilitator family transporter [Burkholderiaceae bacterium]|nr:cation diffusion facilitator family transporter [Burkholderiaceae bacterium]
MKIQRYLQASVAAAVATIVLKMTAWWVTDSVGLLSDALESLVNLVAALFALWMVTVSLRPADAGHPFGHGKAEYFSSGLEGLLILVAAGGILVTAVQRLLHPVELETLGLGVVLSLVSSAINAGVAWMLIRASREHRSIALEADGRHLMTDVYTSVGVVAGLLLVPLTGWHWLDPVLAIAVALNIAREGASLLSRSADGLMDHALDETERREIERAIAEQVRDSAPDGVRVDDLRTRRAGRLRFCELHLHVPEQWSVGRAMQLRQSIARALIARVPGLRVTIELATVATEPLDANPGLGLGGVEEEG